jgi:predicted nucleic acid-binding protein
MSKFVLDASVALKMLLIEVGSEAAIALRDDFRQQFHELIAPDTMPVEVAHALTRAERKGIIKVGQGHKLFVDFLTPCPRLYAYGDLIDRAIEISSVMRIGVYDCLYIALAEDEECKVVSDDARMIELFPDHVIALGSL